MPKQGMPAYCIFSLILAAIIGLPSLTFAEAAPDGANIVKGKIGIAIFTDDKSKLARKSNRITTLDKLKVYTLPEFKSYTYVISSDKKTAILLIAPSKGNAIVKEGLSKYPEPNQFYQFDENSDEELITVICSPTELKEVQELFSSKNVSHKSWEALEKKLIKRSKTLASKDVPKENQIAGTVNIKSKIVPGIKGARTFVDLIPSRRGYYFLIKNYEFRIFNAKK